MLRFTKPETAAQFAPAASVDSSRVEEAPVAISSDEARIAAYLDAVVQRLAPLPPTTRDEIRRELRQHLDGLIVAHEELGSTHDAAIDAAIRQFGDAKQIATRFRHAWTAGTLAPLPRFAASGFGLSLLAAFVSTFCVMHRTGVESLGYGSAYYLLHPLHVALTFAPLLWMGSRIGQAIASGKTRRLTPFAYFIASLLLGYLGIEIGSLAATHLLTYGFDYLPSSDMLDIVLMGSAKIIFLRCLPLMAIAALLSATRVRPRCSRALTGGTVSAVGLWFTFSTLSVWLYNNPQAIPSGSAVFEAIYPFYLPVAFAALAVAAHFQKPSKLYRLSS